MKNSNLNTYDSEDLLNIVLGGKVEVSLCTISEIGAEYLP